MNTGPSRAMESPARPSGFPDRFRLYIDESGDHVFRNTEEPPHRYLCLLGCWFQNSAYLEFHASLEEFKKRHLPHHPDDPVVLHREDVLHARRAFSVLRDETRRAAFDAELLDVIARAEFRVVAVVVDKLALLRAYGGSAAHPYHLALGFLLQRYAGYLNHIQRIGDVLAESRGGTEDRLLKESYHFAFERRGVWMTGCEEFQRALTSRELKLKPKSANIAGLQLADSLGHPTKQWVLGRHGRIANKPKGFAARLMPVVERKLNRQLYDNRVEGYGYVLFPREK